MRLIGDLDNSQQAHQFTAYLLVKGIENHVDQDGEKFEIWVKEEDRFKEALQELDEFKANPGDQKYSEAIPQAKAIVRSELKKRQAIQKKVVRVNAQNLRRRPPVTVACIAVSILVAILTNFGDFKSFEGPVMQALAFTSVSKAEFEQYEEDAAFASRDDPRFRTMSLAKGEIWRVITPIFIHFGVIHILFNMYMFYQFGSILEFKLGSIKFALLIVATAAISNLVQCLVPEAIGGSAPSVISDLFITPLGGMSGVVYGLFGFFWMKSTYDRNFGYRIPESTIVILLAWLVLCMLPINMGIGSVANWAHGIGLAVGMAIGYGSSMIRS